MKSQMKIEGQKTTTFLLSFFFAMKLTVKFENATLININNLINKIRNLLVVLAHTKNIILNQRKERKSIKILKEKKKNELKNY